MNKKWIKILIAFDISTTITGYAIFVNEKLYEYDTIIFKDIPNAEKITHFAKKIKLIIFNLKINLNFNKYKIKFTILREDVFVGANAKTALLLARWAGMFDYYIENEINIKPIAINNAQVKYNTLKIKASPFDSKKKIKLAIVERVNELFNLRLQYKEHDIADAIALGYHFLLNKDKYIFY